MINFPCGHERPPIHLLASESDLVASLALQAAPVAPVTGAIAAPGFKL